MLDPWNWTTLAIIAATFVLGGFVRGIVGLGMPTIALALLGASLGLKTAVALIVIPTFAFNVWQAVVGGAFVALISRLWSFLLAAGIATWAGSMVLAQADTGIPSVLLGLVLCAYAVAGLMDAQPRSLPAHEIWLTPLMGALNGALTGLTGAFVVPGVLYLEALGLNRDALIQAMGMLFSVSAVVLALSLAEKRILDAELAMLSSAALLPALAGMALGQRLRSHIPEKHFRSVFFGALFLLGGYIAAKSVL